ncbi:MAG: AMP-binding protein, partial [Candidatus Eremiobacteraeota bacterium]|nr:AMP-binding protein [Candidatus Eremiobacteraeota bacterium]
TSGSTGDPKGVLLPYHRWTSTLRDGLKQNRVPRIGYNYLPMYHMAGRITLYKSIMAGGLLYLTASPDMSELFQELALARPTHLLLVPRVSQMLFQEFQRRFLEEGRPPVRLHSPLGRRVAGAMRQDLFGGRLCFVHTGAAPTAEDAAEFLRVGLGVHLTDVYGSTEMGPVAVNGRVHSWLRYKLVDRPELGYTRADKPYPRGELAIQSPRATTGYHGGAEGLYDDQGYLLSGDIVEERARGRIVWLDRAHSVLRLGHGQFVRASMLEELLAAHSPYIEQVYLYGNPRQSYLIAVVVPTRLVPAEGAEELLRAEIDRIAGERGLESFEVPRQLLLEWEPFSRSNGLLSAANKPLRPRLRSRYGARLEELYRQAESRRQRSLQLPADEPGRLRACVAQILGLERVDLE